MAVSIVVAALSHSPQLLLAKDGLVTGLWGAVFVASVAARRPVAFTIARPLMEGRKAFTVLSWDDLWDREPAFRRIWRVSSLVWGGALLGDAAVRIIMAYRPPADEVPRLSGVLWPCTFVVIQVVTNLYYRRCLPSGHRRGRGSSSPGPSPAWCLRSRQTRRTCSPPSLTSP